MENEETRIIFTSPEEMEKRRNHIKSFKNVKVRPQLVEDSNEKIRNVCELMILEGFSDELIDELLTRCADPDRVETLDFLHMAALVMGESFVREKLVGKVISCEEACRLIRENYHDEAMKPYREIYENLDEKIRAALEGEDKVSHQIEILKLQSKHADEMYKQRLSAAKVQFDCDLTVERTKAQVQKERSDEKIAALEEKLREARDRLDAQKKEYEVLLKEAIHSKRRDDGAMQSAGSKNEERERQKRSWHFGRKQAQEKRDGGAAQTGNEDAKKKDQKVPATPASERREFCLHTLANQKFSAVQLDLILPCLLDDTIPLSTLKLLCRPDLPAQNMKGFIRFIEGGKKDNGNK